jgi:hypothetical protein
MPDLVLALDPVRCPKSDHQLFRLFAPQASFLEEIRCKCGRTLMVRVRDGIVEVIVEKDKD